MRQVAALAVPSQAKLSSPSSPAGVKQGDESASNIIKSDVALEYTSDSDFDAAFFPSGDDRYLSSLDAAPVIRFARETFRSQKALAAAGKAVPWFMHKVVPGVTSVKAKPEQKYTVSNGVVLGENVADQDTSLWKKVCPNLELCSTLNRILDVVLSAVDRGDDGHHVRFDFHGRRC